MLSKILVGEVAGLKEEGNQGHEQGLGVRVGEAQCRDALALDLGAAPDRAAGLPQLAVRPLATRIQELERAVARLRTELARIQETLKP